jgi:hypothetical protein
LLAIKRDLPQQDDKASAIMFYSKLTRELKRQFKTSDISIPETRAKCVAVAQRIWEGLHGLKDKKLQPKWIKPLRVLERISSQAYRLALPEKYA